jgi:hypothetical protein
VAETVIVVNVPDAWTYQGKNRPNTGSSRFIQVQDGIRRGWTLPQIPSLVGETVLSATLRGHVASSPATTYHLDAVTGRWSAGKIVHGNRPSVDAARRASATVGVLGDGDAVEWDVTAILGEVAAGLLDWWGLRVVSESSTVTAFYSSDSGEPAWELEIVLAEETDAADNLRPDGGAVSADRPELAWDIDGQAEFRVDLYADDETDVVTWSSGWVLGPETFYKLPAGAPAGGWWWTVTTRDTDGGEEVSDRASWTVSPWADLIVDSPTGPFGDNSFTLLAHPVSGEVAWWSAMVTGPSRADVRFETGVQSGPIDYTFPVAYGKGRPMLIEGQRGWLGLTWADGVARTAGPGEPTARTAWIPLDLGSSESVTPTTDVSVTQYAEGDPRQVWSWRRAEAADAYRLLVDGRTVRRVDASEVTVNAGHYSFLDAGEVQPLRQHSYAVLAIDDGVASEAVWTSHGSHVVRGFWILDPSGEREPIVLEGTEVGGIDRGDQVATYTTVEGEEVDLIYGRPGYRGEFSGSVSVVHDRDGAGVWAVLDEVDALIDDLTRVRRLVWGSRTIMARLRSPSWGPGSSILPHNLSHDVKFGLIEAGGS